MMTVVFFLLKIAVTMEDIDLQARFNRTIDDWGKLTKARFLMQIRALPFKQRVMWQGRSDAAILRGRVAMRLQKRFGDVVRVRFPFTQHGIFQEHGVGKGRRKGSGLERPMPWIKPGFDAMVPILADNMKSDALDALGQVIVIKVNGIFEMELK